MASLVAVVSTRPETVADDMLRLLTLAGMAPVREDLALLVPPAGNGPTPAGGLTPWLLSGVAAAREPQVEMTLCRPRNQPLPLEDTDTLRSWRLTPGTWSEGEPAWCLGGVRLHRRLRLEGSLAGALAHLAPEHHPGRLARRPDHLRRLFKELVPRRPDAAVLDLTVCADGPEPLALNLLLAGRDLVAVETVACQLLGISPSSAPLLRAAEAAGWGLGPAGERTVVGDLAPAPVTRTRTGALDPGGWTLDDGPGWLARMAAAWWRWTPAGRGPRRRYETLAWGRRWRDPQRPA